MLRKGLAILLTLFLTAGMLTSVSAAVVNEPELTYDCIDLDMGTLDLSVESSYKPYFTGYFRFMGAYDAKIENGYMRTWRNPSDSNQKSYNIMAPFPGGTSIGTGYFLYNLDVMFPDVDPATDNAYGGGCARMALGVNNENSTGWPSGGIEIVPNRGEEKGSIYIGPIKHDGSESAWGAWIPYDIQPDAWYTFSMLVDLQKDTIDLFVNGKPVAVDLYYSSDVPWTAAFKSVVFAPVSYSVVLKEGYILGDSNAGVNGVVPPAGTGTDFDAGKTLDYSPYPVCFDNLQVATITDEQVRQYTKWGFANLFAEGYLTEEEILLPRNGCATVEDCSFTYETNLTNNINITQRDANSGGAPNAIIKAAITRGEANQQGTFTVNMKKGGATEAEAFTIPVVVPGSTTESLTNEDILVTVPASVDAKTAGENYTFYSEYENLSEVDETCTCVVAVYTTSGGSKKLESISIVSQDLPAETKDVLEMSVEIPELEGDYEVCAYMLDGIATLAPMVGK